MLFLPENSNCKTAVFCGGDAYFHPKIHGRYEVIHERLMSTFADTCRKGALLSAKTISLENYEIFILIIGL